MGQADIIELLEKANRPLSRSEIALKLKSPPHQISITLKKLINWGEVIFEEIDKEEAMKRFNCKHPMKVYTVAD